MVRSLVALILIAPTVAPAAAAIIAKVDGSPAWSSDGTRIAFVRSPKDSGSQIFTIPASGGEAKPLTRFPEGSIGGFKWSPDGTQLAVSFRTEDPEWTKKAKKQREEKGLGDSLAGPGGEGSSTPLQDGRLPPWRGIRLLGRLLLP